MNLLKERTVISGFSQELLPAIEEGLKKVVSQVRRDSQDTLYGMLAYHMGWEDVSTAGGAGGKRIRPLITLLSTMACGSDWEPALPAALSVELIHNFSLIHDDVQDRSPLRRGRPTVWKRWGDAQAINAGDALFTIAHLTLLDLKTTISPEIALKAAKLMQDTCLELTSGQYLDIAYETRDELDIESYWLMVNGKTAALLAASSALGAITSGKEESIIQAYYLFGKNLGLAFQAKDDLLGIWGDIGTTGKSIESDLLTGKKTLPVIYGLNQKGEFSKRWGRGKIVFDELTEITALLEQEGARSYTQMQSDELTEKALGYLFEAKPQGEAGEALEMLARLLVQREL